MNLVIINFEEGSKRSLNCRVLLLEGKEIMLCSLLGFICLFYKLDRNKDLISKLYEIRLKFGFFMKYFWVKGY